MPRAVVPRAPLYPGMSMPESTLSPEDKLQEIRGKIRLKEADGEVFVEGTKATLAENEKTIVTLRAENMKKRVELAHGINNDRNVICTVLHDRKEDKLSKQRFSMDKVLYAMDQKVCEASNRLNVLQYESAKRDKQLQELEDQLMSLLTLEYEGIDSEEQRAFRRLQNEMDKSRVKNDAAKNITRRYEEILRHLKNECLLYPGKLDRLEKQITEAAIEINDAHSMKLKAVKTCDESHKHMYTKEHQIIQSKRVRDKMMNEAKKDAEHQQDMLDKLEKKPRVSLITERETESPDGFVSRKELILGLEDCFDKLKRAIDVTDITDVVSHVKKQETMKENLLKAKDQMIQQILDQRKELDTQKAVLEDIKFSHAKTKARAKKHVDEMADYAKGEEERRDNAQLVLEEKNKLKCELHAGIDTLYEKLTEIKLKLPMSNYKKGNAVEDLASCEKKLVMLMEMIKAESRTYRRHDDTSQLQDFMDKCIPLENIRIKFDMGDQLDEDVFMFDHDQDNEGHLTREDIKRKAWDLLKPKRRKGRAAKNT